jgi:glycosyltransferase involved in cell wall biosynthesis
MKILVGTVRAPFMVGGAEALAEGLVRALNHEGHEADLFSLPFRFGSGASAHAQIQEWRTIALEEFDTGSFDLFIPLKFPAWCARHRWVRPWVLHQHRSVYELWSTKWGDGSEAAVLREAVRHADREAFAASDAIFTISETVSSRLLVNNGFPSAPLSHPPPDDHAFRRGPFGNYILAPGRLEPLKRFDLAIRALPFAQGARLVIVGDGSARRSLEALALSEGVADRVEFTGRLPRNAVLDRYAEARAVYFAPFDEDYGYVAVEAMLAGKPVITCIDSGGPTEIVIDNVTGAVTSPTPQDVGVAIARYAADIQTAQRHGANARDIYDALILSWRTVVRVLTGEIEPPTLASAGSARRKTLPADRGLLPSAAAIHTDISTVAK